MKHFLLALGALLTLACAPLAAHAQATNNVFAACSAQSYATPGKQYSTMTQTGDLCVRAALAAGGAVQTITGTTGGSTTKTIQVANNTTSIAVCTTTCTLYGGYVSNNSATVAYVKIYNAVQGSTTCGSGTPVDRWLIPASTSGAGFVLPIAGSAGAAYSTALTVCITTGYADNDASAPAATTYLLSLYYK